jgi:hypothetical protein
MPEIVGRLRPPRLSTPPASPAEGETYYDTATKILYFWNGTIWVPASSAMALLGSKFVLDGTPANGGGSWTIPSWCEHLQLRGRVTVAPAGTFVTILRFNGDAANNYWTQMMWSYATTPASANTGWVSYGKAAGDIGNQGHNSFVCDIFNIRHASMKAWVSSMHYWSASGSINYHLAGAWNSSAIITSMTFGAGTYMSGELSLYGLR